MATMGEVLRDARQRRSLSLDQVETETRIRKKYVVAMEEDDYDELPAAVYSRGFLQIYADFLGIDPEFAQKLFEPPQRPVLADAIKPAASGFREARSFPFHGLLSVALVAVGAAALFYLYAQYAAYMAGGGDVLEPKPTAVSTVTRAVAAPIPTPSPVVLPTPSPTAVRGVEVVVQATERSWLRVVADGQSNPLFEGELNAGDTRSWKANDRIDMRVGNAGGVEVTVNGMRQGRLGASGEVKNVTWGRQ